MLGVYVLAAFSLTIAPQTPPPTAPPAAPLTLARAIADARARSPLRGSAERLAEGLAAAARLAGRAPNPVLDVRGENWTPSPAQIPLDLFATVSQTIELGGKRSARQGVAYAEQGVADAALARLDRQIALRTAELYIQALRARGLFETLSANRDGLVTLTATMRRRVDEGRSAEADLLKFATESARVDIDIAHARLALGRSLSALAFVIGSAAPIAPGQLVEPPMPALPAATAEMMTRSAAEHPDARSAAARLEQARLSSALERAKGVPDPIFTGGYKRTAGSDALVAGVTMAVPLFDRNKAAAARAAAEERAAAAELDAVIQRIASETASLVETASALSERAERASAEMLEPAAVVRSAALATFREGAADVLRLIDAERVYADVRRAVLELRLEALVATIEARFALGEEAIP
jgi:cobalt-zinc-cadmium efflux system outer membrane protein